MPGQYRILHLSDIHFRQKCNGNVVLHDDVRNELFHDASKVREELGDADAVVVTGDIAYSGRREEYEEAGDWLDQLCGAVGCPEHSVQVIPGNHDINWSEVTPTVEDLHARITNAHPNELDARISERFHNDKVAYSALLAKFGNYREFANRYGKDFDSGEHPYWADDIRGLGPPVIRVIGMNTVLFSGKGDVKGKLALGQNQYTTLRRISDIEYMILLHHPPEWFKDNEKALNYFENRARIWLMGHEHTLRVNRSANMQGFERLEVHAGAVCPQTEDGYEFRYNWLTLSVSATEAGYKLIVVFWPRVWTFASTEFVADTNRLQGQEHKDFSLLLSGETAEMVLDGRTEANEDHIVPSLVDPDVEEPSKSEGRQCIARGDRGFRRLQFLFWRKLDRNQRVHVLAELNMLPEDFQMPPVWLRRGLDAARHQGRLRELWDTVMSHLPVEQREPNPFERRTQTDA